MSPQRRHAGFTLIEVLIAASILAVMAALVFGMFYRQWKEKEEVQGIDDRYAQIRGALDRMSTEISEAYLSDHFDKKRYQTRPTIFRGRSDELLFTSLAHERFEADAKTGDQAVVSYFLERDPAHQGEEALFRKVNPVIDEDADRRGRKSVICEDVKRIHFEYWDTVRIDWSDEWDSSRTEHQGVMPERVRITLTAIDENGKERTFSTQTRIMLQRSLAF